MGTQSRPTYGGGQLGGRQVRDVFLGARVLAVEVAIDPQRKGLRPRFQILRLFTQIVFSIQHLAGALRIFRETLFGWHRRKKLYLKALCLTKVTLRR